MVEVRGLRRLRNKDSIIRGSPQNMDTLGKEDQLAGISMTGAEAVGESILKQSYKDEIACSMGETVLGVVAVYQLVELAFE